MTWLLVILCVVQFIVILALVSSCKNVCQLFSDLALLEGRIDKLRGRPSEVPEKYTTGELEEIRRLGELQGFPVGAAMESPSS